ncbi:NitT/TauT family transport system substrate-binding protein [Methylomarinovum tepidoasis]|uniref:NitT/TauT family transport system substrate-binding protein n=1 Tax=Methylomarinovum tepidoasis TaxID=2840183 RepID=A0AAU9C1C0_9GAMM|nr:PhnD/SsuA/transferrin family substrate-binding protein [Methylomarinovum sp. IN45]BCX89728.1 NitT/TauT family transport system substrate-binding protein [Methylomarinovum sp. IN45]
MKAFLILTALLAGLVPQTQAGSRDITVGALAYGTFNWELTVIEREGLDRRQGFRLKIRKLANPQAGRIGLQGGSVDLIVTNWLWVARQRSGGYDFTAVPYSLTHGALIVPPKSPIHTLADLKGKRIGVAGSPLYENWILLKTLARRQHGLDLEQDARPVFGAPPLLNQQLRQGRLDALLNYWHYAARLEAAGYRRLLDGGDLLTRLGITPPVPTLSYVFRERWAADRRDTVTAFLRAAYGAKDAICGDRRVWRYVAPLTGSTDPKIQATLRQRYCQGRLRHWGAPERKAAARLYALLHEAGGDALTGPAAALPRGTFWADFVLPR